MGPHAPHIRSSVVVLELHLGPISRRGLFFKVQEIQGRNLSIHLQEELRKFSVMTLCILYN